MGGYYEENLPDVFLMDDQVFTKYLQNYPEVFADLTDITWDQFIEIGKVVKEKTGMPMLTNVQGEPDLLNMILQSAYFSDDTIYSKIVSYGGKIPTVNKGIYWTEEKEALGIALSKVINGKSDLDAAIAEAQSTVEFNTGE